jgi:hypothetical protein
MLQALLSRGRRQSYYRPVRRCRGNPLITPVRGITLEVWPDREYPAFHVRKPVGEVCVPRELDATLIRGVGHGDRAGFAEYDQCLASSLGHHLQVREAATNRRRPAAPR